MKVASFVVILLLSVPLLFAANGTMVQIPIGQEKIAGYLVKPSGKGPFPALVLVHEWWGLNDQIKGIADRLAGEGYESLAVDLYGGRVAADTDQAHMLMAGLSDDNAVRYLQAGFDYVQSQPDVQKDRIGSIGWCMGGSYSLLLALNQPKLAACVMFYGRVVLNQEKMKNLNCPVLGLFGEKDQVVTPMDTMQFKKMGEVLGKDVEVYEYKDAGHAFFNETGKNYNAEASKDAWSKTIPFLAKNLKKS